MTNYFQTIRNYVQNSNTSNKEPTIKTKIIQEKENKTIWRE